MAISINNYSNFYLFVCVQNLQLQKDNLNLLAATGNGNQIFDAGGAVDPHPIS